MKNKNTIRYGSVCSGVEAATMAWHSLGWSPQWFAEFDKFPSAVLAHHYPNVPNLGDMTTIRKHPIHGKENTINLMVGGTPCQSFSVAGIRKGLDDERGNLSLEFCRIADKLKPNWLLWENVPGVLSSGGGEDFRSIIEAFTEIGYGVAWRVLDAQYFGLAQRRKRIFVVGYLGDWRPAQAVLLEQSNLCGDSSPRKREETLSFGESIGSVETYRSAGFGSYRLDNCSATLTSQGTSAGGGGEVLVVNLDEEHRAPRKLTPIECERLQGFPDNYTRIPWRGKAVEDCPDGPRYKAIGNSMAVPVMRWIGERIQMVEDIIEELK